MEILKDIASNLIAGNDAEVAELVGQAIASEVPTTAILDDGLIAGMTVVGDRFRKHEMFLPEVLLAARAMTAGVTL